MIQDRAVVTRVTADAIYVNTLRKSTCSGCKASAGCGNALLENLFAGRNQSVRVLPAVGIQQGDEVIIGMHEGALLRGSFAVYSVPLLLMLVASTLVSLFIPSVTDGWVALAGLTGLLTGFAWLNIFSNKIHDDKRYQPVLIKKC
jgi:sigma-E factor negative regulatory protein RseC